MRCTHIIGLQVVTCVKLKYVQPPVGKTAGMGSAVIRPSKSVIYDTREAVVAFLSEDVNTCVDEFLDEWARVSTIVVIAREGDKICIHSIDTCMLIFWIRISNSFPDGQGEELGRRPLALVRPSNCRVYLRYR